MTTKESGQARAVRLPLKLDGEINLIDVKHDGVPFVAFVISDQDDQIAYIPEDLRIRTEEAAEFIIQACNSYEALLAAVKAREDEVRHARDCHSCSPGFSCTEGSRLFLDALRLRREALAQVDTSPQYPPPPLNQPEVG